MHFSSDTRALFYMGRCAVRGVLLRASKVVVLAFEQFRPTPMRQLTVSFGKRWNRRLKTAYLYYLREKKRRKFSHEKRGKNVVDFRSTKSIL